MWLNDVSKPITGYGADAKGGQNYGKILSRFDEFAQNLRVQAAERPVSLQRGPQCKRGREVAEEKVREGEGEDERVPGVGPQLVGGQHRDEEEGVQRRAQDHHG